MTETEEKPTKKKKPTKPVRTEFTKQALNELEGQTLVQPLDEGELYSRVSFSRSSKGREGIKIRSARRTWGFNEHRYGVWLPKGVDLTGWIKWVVLSIKKYSKKFWGTEVGVNVLEEEIGLYREQRQVLEGELLETRQRLQDAEALLEVERDDRQRAGQLVSKVDEYERELEELIVILDHSRDDDARMEADVKRKIRANRWILGLDCEIGAAEKPIDVQASLDLHIITDFNQDKIFEFKSPNLQLFFKKKDDARLFIEDELSQAINQLIIYLRKTNLHSFSAEGGSYGIRGPSGVVVMGYRLDKEQVNAIKDWNFHLRPHVWIVTYDELIAHAKRQIENIRRVKNTTQP